MVTKHIYCHMIYVLFSTFEFLLYEKFVFPFIIHKLFSIFHFEGLKSSCSSSNDLLFIMFTQKIYFNSTPFTNAKSKQIHRICIWALMIKSNMFYYDLQEDLIKLGNCALSKYILLTNTDIIDNFLPHWQYGVMIHCVQAHFPLFNAIISSTFH